MKDITLNNKTMYATSIVSDQSDFPKRGTGKLNQLNSLLNLVNITYGQLTFIKAHSPNGVILDEIIEYTEVLAYNIKHNPAIALNKDYIKEYQKTVWQVLSQLDEADQKDGLPSQWEEQQGVFFELFKQIDDIIEKRWIKILKRKLAGVN